MKERNILIGLVIFILITGLASASGIEKIVTGYTTTSVPTDEINVYITAIDAQNIANIQLNFEYNPDVIIPEKVDKGNLTSTGGTTFISEIDKSAGIITIKINNSGGFEIGTGPIAYMKFKAVGKQGESSPLNVSIIKILDTANNEITVSNIENKEFIVGRTMIVGPGGATDGGGVTDRTPEATETEIIEETPTPTETVTDGGALPTPEETKKETPGFIAIISIAAILIVYRLVK